MDTALPQKFPFILERNLAKAYCMGNRVCTSCDTVVLGRNKSLSILQNEPYNEFYPYGCDTFGHFLECVDFC